MYTVPSLIIDWRSIYFEYILADAFDNQNVYLISCNFCCVCLKSGDGLTEAVTEECKLFVTFYSWNHSWGAVTFTVARKNFADKMLCMRAKKFAKQIPLLWMNAISDSYQQKTSKFESGFIYIYIIDNRSFCTQNLADDCTFMLTFVNQHSISNVLWKKRFCTPSW